MLLGFSYNLLLYGPPLYTGDDDFLLAGRGVTGGWADGMAARVYVAFFGPAVRSYLLLLLLLGMCREQPFYLMS